MKAWQSFSLKVIMKGLKKCCISNAVGETDDGMLWNDIEEDWNFRSECEVDEDTVTVTLTGKGRQNLRHALCVKYMKLIVKYIFFTFYFSGVVVLD